MWVKKGTCSICGKRLQMTPENKINKHKYNKVICEGSGLAAKDVKYEQKVK